MEQAQEVLQKLDSLTAQMKSLLAASQTQMSDLYRVHAKLLRLEALERENIWIQQTFPTAILDEDYLGGDAEGDALACGGGGNGQAKFKDAYGLGVDEVIKLLGWLR